MFTVVTIGPDQTQLIGRMSELEDAKALITGPMSDWDSEPPDPDALLPDLQYALVYDEEGAIVAWAQLLVALTP